MKFLVTLTILCFSLAYCEGGRDKIFFFQSSGDENETLLVVTWSESEHEISAGCEIFKDRDLINEVIKSSNEAPIRTLSEDEMANVLEDCTESTFRRRKRQAEEDSTEPCLEDYVDYDEMGVRRNRRRNQRTRSDRQGRRIPANSGKNDIRETTTLPTTTAEPRNGLPLIFPGTKWCGAGDIAKNYDDLGLHQDTDRCCRAHDLCNDTMAPKETKNGLTNKSPFTALSCKCDQDFYNCLDNIDSITSNTVGNAYFNVLKRPCYEKDYPDSKKCNKYRTLLRLKCVEYEKDTSKPKVMRWKPAKKYNKLPFPGPLTITLPF